MLWLNNVPATKDAPSSLHQKPPASNHYLYILLYTNFASPIVRDELLNNNTTDFNQILHTAKCDPT